MLYSCNTRDVIYTARSNTSHPPTSPKHCGCHAKWNCRKWEKTAEKSFTARSRSENDPTWDYISIKTNMSRSCYHCKFHKLLPLPRKVTVQLHQILPLPRKISVQLDCNFTKDCACHEKWHSNTILWLYSSSPLLIFDSTILWLYHSFTLRCRSYIRSFSTRQCFLWLVPDNWLWPERKIWSLWVLLLVRPSSKETGLPSQTKRGNEARLNWNKKWESLTEFTFLGNPSLLHFKFAS